MAAARFFDHPQHACLRQKRGARQSGHEFWRTHAANRLYSAGCYDAMDEQRSAADPSFRRDSAHGHRPGFFQGTAHCRSASNHFWAGIGHLLLVALGYAGNRVECRLV